MRMMMLLIIFMLAGCADSKPKASTRLINIQSLWSSPEGSQWDLREIPLEMSVNSMVPLEGGCRAKLRLSGDYFSGSIRIEDLGDHCLSQTYLGTYWIRGNELILCIQDSIKESCQNLKPN